MADCVNRLQWPDCMADTTAGFMTWRGSARRLLIQARECQAEQQEDEDPGNRMLIPMPVPMARPHAQKALPPCMVSFIICDGSLMGRCGPRRDSRAERFGKRLPSKRRSA